MGEATCQDGAHSRCLRLPLQLLEIALRELEQGGHEAREPRVQEHLAAFSERLRTLSATGAQSTSTQPDSVAPKELPLASPRWGWRPVGDTAVAETSAVTSAMTAQRGEVEPHMKRTPPPPTPQTNTRTVREHSKLFHQLDLDGNGTVGVVELSVALRGNGMSDRAIKKFVEEADASGDGSISHAEFIRALESHSLRDTLAQGSFDFNNVKKHACMLSQSSPVRLCWDVACSCALAYLAIVEPLLLAFPRANESANFTSVSIIMDVFFLTDVLLNFRTGFYTADGFEVLDPQLVAKNYLKTWFAPDLISSLPLSAMTANSVGDMQALRLLKYWKVAKVFKALRFSRSVKSALETDFFMDIQERVRRSKIYTLMPMFSLLLAAMLSCHWLGCFMIVSGDGFLSEYLEPQAGTASEQHLSEYIASFYWACTTVSTVGYGDITPGSNWERLYTVIAMTVGGALYAFCIGKFTAICTRSELSEQVYLEKMDEVEYWLSHHQFPRDLRRRTRRYFERFFRQKAHVDDQDLLDSLSPDLRGLLSEHIVVPEVRNLHIFDGLPAGFMSHVAKILQHVEVQESEHIVQRGEVGNALYVITSGEVKLEVGDKDTDDAIVLEHGDSFGEELLLDSGSLYSYTAIATTPATLKSLSVAAFLSEFERFPLVIEQIAHNAASVSRGGGKNIKVPKPFEKEVIELLREVHEKNTQEALSLEAEGRQTHLRKLAAESSC